jgi:hypothetical protein
MLNKFLLIITLFAVVVVSQADEVQVRPDHPDRYVVVKGDTLWDISDRFLANPWLWPKVWNVNPHIENPHLIYPGDVVALKYIDGVPYLEINGEIIPPPREAAIRRGGDRDSRYMKLEPKIRVIDKQRAVPSIPIDIIKQFLTRPLVVDADEMEGWPYVVSSYDQHLVAGTGDKIYVRGVAEDTNATRYAIYRKGPAYVNPVKDEKEILGYEALYIGDAYLTASGDPTSLVVSESNREILVGDRLIEQSDSEFVGDFIPVTPDQEVSGNLISVIDGVAEIGQYQIVVVDLGFNDGMQPGTVLGVYQSGKFVDDYVAAGIERNTTRKQKYQETIEDTDLIGYLGRQEAKAEKVELPREYAGIIMVFRTFEKVSYALVMEAIAPMHKYDSVSNL